MHTAKKTKKQQNYPSDLREEKSLKNIKKLFKHCHGKYIRKVTKLRIFSFKYLF